MSKKIGICGLPNSGKSTFLKLITTSDVEIGIYPFTTKKPNVALAQVVSENLLKLHQITKTKDLIPAYLEFIDIPGLIKGAHKGLGLGNEFLSYLRACDIVLEVVRNFKNENVIHVEGDIDVERDILIIEEEVIEADKKIIEENIKKLEKQNKKDILLALKEIKNKLEPFKRFPELNQILKEYNLLLTKDWYLIINGEENINFERLKELCFKNIYIFDFKFESEVEENEELKRDFGSKKGEFLNQFRKDVNLIEFYTFTAEITQAWFIDNNSKILDAAEKIHTDFAKKFKSAEVINIEEFLEIKDWQLAKAKGVLKIVGRDYLLKDGDIVRINI